MKKLTLTITIAAVLGAVFLVLAFPAVSAAGPEEVTFTLDMCYSPEGWAFGAFTAEGAVTGSGTAFGDQFRMVSGTLHGPLWLGIEPDMIIMRFNARVIPDSDTVDKVIGHFVIVSGTGDYEKLHGQGSIDLRLKETPCGVLPFSLTGEYSGVALYAPDGH